MGGFAPATTRAARARHFRGNFCQRPLGEVHWPGRCSPSPRTAELARSESLYRPLAVFEEREAERQ